MDEQLIIDLWDTFKDYIPDKQKETAANQFVDFLVGKDVEPSELEGVLGYDSYLDSAIELVLGDDETEEEEDFEDDWDYDDEE